VAETPTNEIDCDVTNRAVIPLAGSTGHIFRLDGAVHEERVPASSGMLCGAR